MSGGDLEGASEGALATATAGSAIGAKSSMLRASSAAARGGRRRRNDCANKCCIATGISW
eukprot:4034286-Alexandrium_andersonii.AAC.1